jgi:Putative phage tail protein
MAAIAVELVIGLGGMLLSALFSPKPKPHEGSRLSSVNVPPVSPGNIVPRVWGTFKVPAQPIFVSPLIETMHTHQASKKGGGKGMSGSHSAVTHTYTYSIDGAWAVCGGPIYQINRIWAAEKLLYVNPVVAANSATDFYNAYESEASRLIDEEGVPVDQAAASAFVFAWNNYQTQEVTLNTPIDAINYIMANPINTMTEGTVTPDYFGVYNAIEQLYSSLNKDNNYLEYVYRYDLIEIYLGSDYQVPNSLLEGYLGTGNVPAYRNCCYFVLTNLQLMDFGNSIPTMKVEVQRTPGGQTSLVEILTDLCYQSGLTDGQFDAASNVDSTPFDGFAILANTSARETFAELQKAFAIDAAESGGRIVFSMMNKRASQLFNRDQLGAHQDTEPLPPSVETTIKSDYDLPQRINLKYQEKARNFSPNSLYAARYNTPSLAVEDYDVTVALDRSTAQTAVGNILQSRMMGRRAYKFQLPRQYATCEPTDVFRIPNLENPGFFDEYYCTEVQIGANGVLQISAVDHVYIDPNLSPTDQVATDSDEAIGGFTQLPQSSQTVPFMLDLPLLNDTDKDGPGFYVQMAGAFNSWNGGQLYVDAAAPSVATAYGADIITPTSGSAWYLVASNSINVPQGTVLNALAPGMVGCYWDRESSLLVRIANGMDLVSAAEDDILIQPLNATVIGGEVVQYADVVDLGNGLWRVSTFLRGLRGTDNQIDGHAAGERFVRLSPTTARVQTTIADVNQTDSFQALTTGASTSTAVTFSFSDTGASLKPLTPLVYRKFRNVDGDIEVDWWPRVRQNGLWLSGSDVVIPANDTPETYSVDVLNAGKTAVVATYSVAGSLGGAFAYSAADQTTDFGAPQSAVNIMIYQVSQVIGRGFPIGVTV